jgi:hypothetical protein
VRKAPHDFVVTDGGKQRSMLNNCSASIEGTLPLPLQTIIGPPLETGEKGISPTVIKPLGGAIRNIHQIPRQKNPINRADGFLHLLQVGGGHGHGLMIGG